MAVASAMGCVGVLVGIGLVCVGLAVAVGGGGRVGVGLMQALNSTVLNSSANGPILVREQPLLMVHLPACV